jgi:hypothetical protein
LLPSGSEHQLSNPLPALFWTWLVSVFVHWDFCTGGLILCPIPFIWGRLCSTHPFCCHVLLQFVDYFSVLQGSLVLDAALWLRK